MEKLLSLPILASIFVTSCGGTVSRKMTVAQPATGAEEPLFNEINKVHLAEGKEVLRRSAKLDDLAASESTRLAASGEQKDDILGIRARSGYGRAAILISELKDRGSGTGTSYPAYRMKRERGKNSLLGDWHRLGVGTAQSAKGELISVAVFGGIAGGALISPMMFR